jgi:hypothetical protein
VQLLGAARPALLERVAQSARGVGELVEQAERALASQAGLAGGVHGLGGRRAHRVGGSACRGLVVGALLGLLLGHVAMLPVPILAAVAHLLPTAALAERALLPDDPGQALALTRVLYEETPRMFNHHRGLWGYTGVALDGAALTIQSTGIGGPSAAIVVGELHALGLRRAVRIGRAWALDGASAGELVVATSVLAFDGAAARWRAPAPRPGRRAGRGSGRRPRRPLGFGRRARGRREVRRRRLRPRERRRAGRRPPCRDPGGVPGGHRGRGRPRSGGRAPRPRRAGRARAYDRGVGSPAPGMAPASPASGAGSPATTSGAGPLAPASAAGSLAPEFAAAGRLPAGSALGRLASRRQGRAQGGDLLAERGQPRFDRRQAVGLAAGGAQSGHALVQAVDAVLDPLEALRDRAHAPRKAFDVGGGGDVERPEGHLLGLGGALSRLEGAGDRPAHDGVLEQLLGQAAQRVLSLLRQPSAQPVAALVAVHAHTLRQAARRVP